MNAKRRALAVIALALAALAAAAACFWRFAPVLTAQMESWQPYSFVSVRLYRDRTLVMSENGDERRSSLTKDEYKAVIDTLRSMKHEDYIFSPVLDGAQYKITYFFRDYHFSSADRREPPRRVLAILYP